MPRTAEAGLGSTGRNTNNVKRIVTAKDIAANEDWLADAEAGRLELVIEDDFVIPPFKSEQDLYEVTPQQMYSAILSVKNAYQSDLEDVFPNRKIVVSHVPAPKKETGAQHDWEEYTLDTTPEDEGGRAKKETAAQRRNIGSVYVYVGPKTS